MKPTIKNRDNLSLPTVSEAYLVPIFSHYVKRAVSELEFRSHTNPRHIVRMRACMVRGKKKYLRVHADVLISFHCTSAIIAAKTARKCIRS